jgi:sentrin-specific protease 8
MNTTKILSYHDVILRQCDIDCLEPGQWLNDQCMEFYLTYLEHNVSPSPSLVTFIPPSTTFLLLHASEDVAKSIAESLNLEERLRTDGHAVFFALNNNSNVESLCGGTHWSSLVMCHTYDSKGESILCRHCDSNNGMNDAIARHLTVRMHNVLGTPSTKPSFQYFQVQNFPQQNNSYDCGLYCLTLARHLCEHGQREVFLNDSNVRKEEVGQLRRCILDLIESLKNMETTL